MANFPKGGRTYGMLNFQQTDPSLQNQMDRIYAMSPLLSKYRNDFAVMRGRPMIPGDNRQLESYAPDESWNPVPGKATTELYNNSAPSAEQQQLITGDMLHHLANVDPTWDAMKRDVLPQELHDPSLYRSRGDEFLMGYLTPDSQDNWRNVYTPEQRAKLEKMKAYLFGTRGR